MYPAPTTSCTHAGAGTLDLHCPFRCSLILGSGSRVDSGHSIPLSELGSVQLEFAALAAALARHGRRSSSSSSSSSESSSAIPDADVAFRSVLRLPALDGLYPSRLRPRTGGPASKDVGFGAGSDSFYETL